MKDMEKKFNQWINPEDVLRIEKQIQQDPELLVYIKQLAWWAVQHSGQLQKEEPVIKRSMIDEYIDLELEFKKDES